MPSFGSFIWSFKVFIVYHLLTLTLQLFSSFFHISFLPFSFFVPWSYRLLFINLFCLLHGVIHFSSSTSLSPLSYRPRYSFLSMILLAGRLVCLFILWKCFYMVQISLPIYLSSNFSKYFQFFFSYNFISNAKNHCIFSFFFYSSNSCTLHWFIFYILHQKSFTIFSQVHITHLEGSC